MRERVTVQPLNCGLNVASEAGSGVAHVPRVTPNVNGGCWKRPCIAFTFGLMFSRSATPPPAAAPAISGWVF